MNANDKMNRIFNDFEENHFRNEGVHCRSLNLIFEFADWIDTDEGESHILELFEPEELESVKGKFSKGINAFLDERKKTSYPFLF